MGFQGTTNKNNAKGKTSSGLPGNIGSTPTPQPISIIPEPT